MRICLSEDFWREITDSGVLGVERCGSLAGRKKALNAPYGMAERFDRYDMIINPKSLKVFQVIPKKDRVKIRLHCRKRIERSKGALFVPPDILLLGQTVRYSKFNEAVLFITKDMRAKTLTILHDYLYIPQRWIYEASIVLGPFSWERRKFECRDGVEYESEAGMDMEAGASFRFYQKQEKYQVIRKKLPFETQENIGPNCRIIPRAWNHEHCSFCGQCICDACGPWGYAATENVENSSRVWDKETEYWVCDRCFHEYVEPKNLRFNME